MSSIITAVFKATIGLLVNKGRDKAAEKLKDGDVTDQKFRGLIVREIDDIKSKLDGLSRKDLLASISFFKEGIELLYDVFDKARSGSEYGTVTTEAACVKGLSLLKGVRKLKLSDQDESTTRKLSDAKERFKDARRKATEAFNNEALETYERILAMQYRVMATILEKVDNPAEAVGPCRVCIEELHGLSAVRESFNVELTKSLRARFGKDERRKNISNACHVNFVIYNVTTMVCSDIKVLSNWPSIGSGKDKVNPLRDERLTKVLHKQGMEHCSLTLSFGQEGEEEHKLKRPRGIATNSSGQFIVGDISDSNVKVFDSTGTFINLFSLPNHDVDAKLYVLDVATDMNDNIYVLVRSVKKPGAAKSELFVHKFSKINTAYMHHKFPVRGELGRLTVTDSGKVLVLRSDDKVEVDVYKTDGQFVCAFGKGMLKRGWDITAANDDRVMVVGNDDSCVHIFSEHGNHLSKFKLQGYCPDLRIAFGRSNQHLVAVAGIKHLLHVKIYTKDGEFVRETQIDDERIGDLKGITVTIDGRIAIACGYFPGIVLVKLI